MKFPGRTTRSETLVLKNTLVRKRDRENCVGVCTVGAASSSMTSYRLGVVTKIKVTHEAILFAHSTIHLQHLAAKKLI